MKASSMKEDERCRVRGSADAGWRTRRRGSGEIVVSVWEESVDGGACGRQYLDRSCR